jgi:hypothetical protein
MWMAFQGRSLAAKCGWPFKAVLLPQNVDSLSRPFSCRKMWMAFQGRSLAAKCGWPFKAVFCPAATPLCCVLLAAAGHECRHHRA